MHKNIFFIFLVFLLFTMLVIFSGCSEDNDENGMGPSNPADLPYSVVIDPADFEAENLTGNEFFSLKPGTTFVFEGKNEDDEIVRVEEIVIADTKVIMGVTCRIVNAKEFEAGDLIENTFDWYAQDKDGNVWYFGEDSREIEEGEVVSTAGSWEAGIDGALPGVIMLAKPIEGLWYRQEFYEDEAEDVGLILSLNETITVPYGTFENCLQIAEWNLLEPGIIEHKFYAPGIGLLRAIAVEGESGFEDLISITF